MFCTVVLHTDASSYSGGNYLSVENNSLPSIRVQFRFRSAPTKFGFLARGVYPFHSAVSDSYRHCGTFKGNHTISKDLGAFPAVSHIFDCPNLLFG